MTKKQKKSLQQILIALALVILLKLLLRVLPALPTPVELLLYLIPYLVVGKDVLRKAIKGVKNRQPFDECFLMAVATVGAFALGDYVEGCAVILFYQIGELFQSVAVGKSRQSISSLMDIRPDYANVEDEDGKLEQVDPDDVEVGTVIVVQPGERVPIDGVIVEGTSALNTAALTGESLPRDVQTGDEVISGCVNMTGLLKVKTSKEFGESTVSKILDLVENSSMKKARAENFITRFARVYTPAVCYGALALAFLPPIVLLLMGQPARFGDWIYRALTFLVISCPCALVISIPLSFFGGIGGASACGILVKGSTYLEELARTGIVVFDKTGTLTQGTFKVTGVHPADGITDEQLVEAAAHFRGVAEKLDINPKVLKVDVNTLLYQVPGGMLSNLISQLKQANAEDKYYAVLEEIPNVRKDFGYPPLVTPTSQIVGSQAVLNVLAGERYKMITKESKGLLRGEYGQLPGEVNEEVRKKAIGSDEVITCRPADLLEPEMDKLRAECKEKGLGHCEEDVLSYALFPQVAEKFLNWRDNPHKEEEAPAPAAAPAKAAPANNGPRTLIVEDMTNGVF